MTWSFPVMVLSILTALFFFLKCTANGISPVIPTTSLAGYTIFMQAFVLISLVLPSLILNPQGNSLTGRYSGVGIIAVSAFSGVPLMILNTIAYNLTAWGILRLDLEMAYPAFFYYLTDCSAALQALAILADTVIPAFGICLFFFGLIQPRMRNINKKLAFILISIIYCMFSLSPVGIISSFITCMWCCYLRDRTDNIWGPFACLIGQRLAELILSELYFKIDIFSTLSYSDIPVTVFYAALPGIFIALILLSYFKRLLDDFSSHYGTFASLFEDDPATDELPSFARNLTWGLILSVVLFVILIILTLRGAQL